MPDIRSWSTTAGDNDDADAAINWLEGQLPSTANNSARAMMASVRGTFEGPDSKYNGLEYWDFGITPTRTGNTTFTLPTVDYTTAFVEGRRLRLTDSTTLIATVVSSSFGAGVTTVTVVVDGGTALSASLTKVFLSPQMPTSTSAPAIFDKDSYATTGGTSTAYTAAYNPKLTSLRNGVTVRVKLDQTCGATPTLAVDGLTAKTIVRPGNVAISASDLTANSVLDLTYDSTLDRWVVQGAPVGSVLTQGVHTINFEGRALSTRTTNGPSGYAAETTTNDIMIVGLAYNQTTSQGAQARFVMPKSWNAGTITCRARWTAASGSGTVIWGFRAVALRDNVTIDTAFGTGITVTDTLLTANYEHVSPTSAAVTVGNSPVKEDTIVLEVYRDISDTLNADAVLLSVEVFYTLDAATDA